MGGSVSLVFCQAEDGIRDKLVTGVQTCALPIFSHNIYEWTHPHLAKYAMALGIVAWGEDRTAASSELGIPVRSAAVEPRWDEPSTGGQVAGDRLWVATGGEGRAYDLGTRALVTTLPVPGA